MKSLSELGVSPWPWELIDDETTVVCNIDEGVAGEVAVCNGGACDVANARLVAAAPELYEALREAVNAYCSDCDYCSCDPNRKCTDTDNTCQVKKWRAALAKASGEEEK